MAFFGLLIRGWAAGQLKKNKELAVSGPYAFTRNPLYLGSFFMGIGVTVAGGLWIFVVLFVAFFLWIYRETMVHEAGVLEGHFGDTYVSYKNSVPLFFPSLFPYRPPAEMGLTPTAFSLDLYFRNKEWEAALGYVGGFAILFLKTLV